MCTVRGEGGEPPGFLDINNFAFQFVKLNPLWSGIHEVPKCQSYHMHVFAQNFRSPRKLLFEYGNKIKNKIKINKF